MLSVYPGTEVSKALPYDAFNMEWRSLTNNKAW